ncbi:MAG: potassium-transporting ATPase subunit C [Candidatus Thermoplasmatota archaeon]|nr:potassium-transporting ATPase subunit C [Candidatus Thermoplasmatota archaeon]
MVMKSIVSGLRITAVVFVVLFVFAYGYPVVSSYIDMHIDSRQANGDLIIEDHVVYGSEYLAEAFSYPEFFHPRPSCVGYNLSKSGVPGYSIDNPEVTNLTKEYIHNFEKCNPDVNVSMIPYCMVSYSGSGLDPDIPLQGALIQIPRISQNLSSLIENKTGDTPGVHAILSFINGIINKSKTQDFPIFGTYYVNTIKLNFSILLYLNSRYGINLF